MIRRCLFALACVLPQSLAAHPHIFVDGAVHPIFNTDGALVAVRVVWLYDDLYSELIFEDRGLDPDGDGKLTEDERAALTGFDMNWVPDFNGDLVVTWGEETLALSRPVQPTLDVVTGQILTTHIRTFDAPIPVGDAPVIFSVYDETFYTAYTLALPARVEGRADCTTQVVEPDAEAAYAQLEAALAEFGAEALEAGDFPPVGAAFAVELHLTCPAGA